MTGGRVSMVASEQLSTADRQQRLGEAFDRLCALVPEKGTADRGSLAKEMPRPTALRTDARKRANGASVS